MNDLMKIATSEEMTYLQKVAAIVDEFAAGNVSGEDADTVAQEAGIAPEDLLAMHNAVYGEGEIEKTASAEDEKTEDLEKVASEAADYLVKVAQDENATYLTKCAGVADAYAAGAVTAEEGDEIAVEMGLSPDDVASIFVAAYGEPEAEGDIEKTAGDEALEFLQKVAESEDATYLEKCAGVADAYMADAITADEASEIAQELELSADDVNSVIEAAYGVELEKEAGAKTDAIKGALSNAGKKIKEYSGYSDIKEALLKHKQSKTPGKAWNSKTKKFEGAKEVKEARNKAALAGGAKAAGTTAVVGGAGYGASKLFGKKDEK